MLFTSLVTKTVDAGKGGHPHRTIVVSCGVEAGLLLGMGFRFLHFHLSRGVGESRNGQSSCGWRISLLLLLLDDSSWNGQEDARLLGKKWLLWLNPETAIWANLHIAKRLIGWCQNEIHAGQQVSDYRCHHSHSCQTQWFIKCFVLPDLTLLSTPWDIILCLISFRGQHSLTFWRSWSWQIRATF